MKFLSALLALVAVAPTSARLLAANDPRSVERKAAEDNRKVIEIHESPLEHTHGDVIRHLQSDARAYFPECEGLIPKTCIQILEDICFADPSRFPLIETVGGCPALTAEVHFTRTRADEQYNRVVAVSDVTRTWAVGGRKDCLQHYPLAWVHNGVPSDIGPWDCTAASGGDPATGCMAIDDCCTLIRGSEPIDDFGNGLGCKVQPLARAYEEAQPHVIISEFTYGICVYIYLLNHLYLLFGGYANIRHVSSFVVVLLMTVIKSPHPGYLVAPAKTFYGRDTA